MRSIWCFLMLFSIFQSFSVCLKIFVEWEHGEVSQKMPAVCNHAVKMAVV